MNTVVWSYKQKFGWHKDMANNIGTLCQNSVCGKLLNGQECLYVSDGYTLRFCSDKCRTQSVRQLKKFKTEGYGD